MKTHDVVEGGVGEFLRLGDARDLARVLAHSNALDQRVHRHDGAREGGASAFEQLERHRRLEAHGAQTLLSRKRQRVGEQARRQLSRPPTTTRQRPSRQIRGSASP